AQLALGAFLGRVAAVRNLRLELGDAPLDLGDGQDAEAINLYPGRRFPARHPILEIPGAPAGRGQLVDHAVIEQVARQLWLGLRRLHLPPPALTPGPGGPPPAPP